MPPALCFELRPFLIMIERVGIVGLSLLRARLALRRVLRNIGERVGLGRQLASEPDLDIGPFTCIAWNTADASSSLIRLPISGARSALRQPGCVSRSLKIVTALWSSGLVGYDAE